MGLPSWLPLLGTISAGPLIGAIVVLLIRVGIVKGEQATQIATVVLAFGWCGLALALTIFPDITPVVVAILQFIAALLGAAGFYSFAAFGKKALTL